MAENSMLWTTSGTGDGPSGGFTQANWVDFLRYIFGGLSSTNQAILDLSSGSDLLCSGTASPVAVSSGAAVVYGFFYWNTASVNVTVTTPAIGTTGFRIVLRAGWAAQTVRIALLTSSDGVASIPAVTQTAGTTWEVSLASGTITTGGVIALTDLRQFVHMASRLDFTKLDGGISTRVPFFDTSGIETAVSGLTYDDTNKRLRVQGGIPALTLDETDNAIKGFLLALNNNLLSFSRMAGAFGVQEAVIAVLDLLNGQYTITPQSALPPFIIGANGQGQRVAGLVAEPVGTLGLKRQGGDATNWAEVGNTNQTIAANDGVRIEVGARSLTLNIGVAVNTIAITFPTAFSATPIVTVSFSDVTTGLQDDTPIIGTTNITASGFTVQVYRTVTTDSNTFKFHWIAVGPQ